MASNTYQFCMWRLRDSNIADGHVMPFGLITLRPIDVVKGGVCLNGEARLAHIEFGVQGVSVPISRGSPPTST
jgi:hypothetical protein